MFKLRSWNGCKGFIVNLYRRYILAPAIRFIRDRDGMFKAETLGIVVALAFHLTMFVLIVILSRYSLLSGILLISQSRLFFNACSLKSRLGYILFMIAYIIVQGIFTASTNSLIFAIPFIYFTNLLISLLINSGVKESLLWFIFIDYLIVYNLQKESFQDAAFPELKLPIDKACIECNKSDVEKVLAHTKLSSSLINAIISDVIYEDMYKTTDFFGLLFIKDGVWGRCSECHGRYLFYLKEPSASLVKLAKIIARKRQVNEGILYRYIISYGITFDELAIELGKLYKPDFPWELIKSSSGDLT